MKLRNNSKTARGIPFPDEFKVIQPGQELPVRPEDLKEMLLVGSFKVLVNVGTISVLDGEAPEPKDPEHRPEPKPAELTGEGVEFEALGGGWVHVWVNGLKVTDKGVRQAQADEIAKDYQ